MRHQDQALSARRALTRCQRPCVDCVRRSMRDCIGVSAPMRVIPLRRLNWYSESVYLASAGCPDGVAQAVADLYDVAGEPVEQRTAEVTRGDNTRWMSLRVWHATFVDSKTVLRTGPGSARLLEIAAGMW